MARAAHDVDRSRPRSRRSSSLRTDSRRSSSRSTARTTASLRRRRSITDAAVPTYPSDEVLFQLRQARPYVSVEPRPDGQYQIRAAATLSPPSARGDFEFLQATFPIEQRLSTLANAVQASYNQFTELSFLAHGAEIQLHADVEPGAADLAARVGLRRVLLRAPARRADPAADAGHARRRARRLRDALPMPARDEIGFLVNSFNDMTQRLAKASEDARLEPAAGRERAPQARSDSRAPVDRRRRRWSPTCGSAPPIRRRARSSAWTSRAHMGESLVGARAGAAAARAVRRALRRRISSAATASGASRSCCAATAAGAC